jgi:hypothetical protein
VVAAALLKPAVTTPLTQAFKRHAWSLLAAAAVLLLLGLALYSPERQKGLGEHVANGPMSHIATADVVALRVVSAAGQRRFERIAGAWRGAEGGAPADTSTVGAIETGLRLLHNSPPERSLDVATPEFGLDPAALQVHVQAADGQVFEAEFGAANPMGLARYTRIRSAGASSLQLMPGYVAEAWEQVAAKGAQ